MSRNRTAIEIEGVSVYPDLNARPSAIDFGFGLCQIGSDVYVSDGVNWVTVGAGSGFISISALAGISTDETGNPFIILGAGDALKITAGINNAPILSGETVTCMAQVIQY